MPTPAAATGTARAGRPFPLALPFEPMEARLVDALPEDDGWQFEPKWDGFRCIATRRGGDASIYAKSGKPLGRYFPDILAHLGRIAADDFALDGELVIPVGETLSFDALQMRLHPAASRVAKLVKEAPALLILFDMVVKPGGGDLSAAPLAERRAELERFFAAVKAETFRLSPYTLDRSEAQAWLRRAGGALDGVIAKRRDGPYVMGERAMLKVKRIRTADCVVGGYRYATGSRQVGSLLLGLFNDRGELDHVGFTSGISHQERTELTRKVEALKGPPGFTGRAPGGPSRWSTERSGEWVPMRHELVVEVTYDHVTDDRFRHGTRLVRWRPDKAPQQCRFDQLEREARPGRLIETMIAG